MRDSISVHWEYAIYRAPKTYILLKPISPHTFQMNRQLLAPQSCEEGLVRSRNLSMVYAQEHHHDFSQNQESQSLPSLYHPKGTASGLHT